MTGEPEIQESKAPNSHFGRKCQISTEGECYDASVRKIMLVIGDQNVYPSFVYTIYYIHSRDKFGGLCCSSDIIPHQHRHRPTRRTNFHCCNLIAHIRQAFSTHATPTRHIYIRSIRNPVDIHCPYRMEDVRGRARAIWPGSARE